MEDFGELSLQKANKFSGTDNLDTFGCISNNTKNIHWNWSLVHSACHAFQLRTFWSLCIEVPQSPRAPWSFWSDQVCVPHPVLNTLTRCCAVYTATLLCSVGETPKRPSRRVVTHSAMRTLVFPTCFPKLLCSIYVPLMQVSRHDGWLVPSHQRVRPHPYPRRCSQQRAFVGIPIVILRACVCLRVCVSKEISLRSVVRCPFLQFFCKKLLSFQTEIYILMNEHFDQQSRCESWCQKVHSAFSTLTNIWVKIAQNRSLYEVLQTAHHSNL